jgi:hypothetical protein
MAAALIIHSKAELEALEVQVIASAKRTIERMRLLLDESDPLGSTRQ